MDRNPGPGMTQKETEVKETTTEIVIERNMKPEEEKKGDDVKPQDQILKTNEIWATKKGEDTVKKEGKNVRLEELKVKTWKTRIKRKQMVMIARDVILMITRTRENKKIVTLKDQQKLRQILKEKINEEEEKRGAITIVTTEEGIEITRREEDLVIMKMTEEEKIVEIAMIEGEIEIATMIEEEIIMIGEQAEIATIVEEVIERVMIEEESLFLITMMTSTTEEVIGSIIMTTEGGEMIEDTEITIMMIDEIETTIMMIEEITMMVDEENTNMMITEEEIEEIMRREEDLVIMKMIEEEKIVEIAIVEGATTIEEEIMMIGEEEELEGPLNPVQDTVKVEEQANLKIDQVNQEK